MIITNAILQSKLRFRGIIWPEVTKLCERAGTVTYICQIPRPCAGDYSLPHTSWKPRTFLTGQDKSSQHLRATAWQLPLVGFLGLRLPASGTTNGGRPGLVARSAHRRPNWQSGRHDWRNGDFFTPSHHRNPTLQRPPEKGPSALTQRDPKRPWLPQHEPGTHVHRAVPRDRPVPRNRRNRNLSVTPLPETTRS